MNHQPLPIFVSYASYDNQSKNPEERWLDRLLQFIKPLNLDNSISIWADTELKVGTSWRTEIREAIEKAEVAILLVSPAFLASDFIRTKELPQLLQKANPQNSAGLYESEISEGMLILPILIRPCLINHVQFELLDAPSEVSLTKLSDFQYVPKGSAMNGLVQYEQDKQFELIARRIIDALEIREHQPPKVIPPDDLKELKELIIKFLNQYHQWWFNALRIKNWGGKQPTYEILGEYSTQQISLTLNELVSNGEILNKPGKKSEVYKTNLP